MWTRVLYPVYTPEEAYTRIKPYGDAQAVAVQELLKILRWTLKHPQPQALLVKTCQIKWKESIKQFETLQSDFMTNYNNHMLTQLLYNWVCQIVGFQFVLTEMQDKFSEWCNLIPAETLKDAKSHAASSEREAAAQGYTVTPVDREPAAAGNTATPSDTSPAKRGAAKTKATLMVAARPTGQPSGRSMNRNRNQATKEAAEAQAAIPKIQKQENRGRDASRDAAASAGLTSDMTLEEYWTGLLSTMMERRGSVIADSMKCVA